VPPPFRRQVFDYVHGLAHAGVCATCRMVSTRFVWPGMANDMKEWIRACTSCCRAKVTQQETTGVQKIDVPAVRFSHVHVDLVGPLPPSASGHTYLFTMVDRSTRWPEVCLMRDTSAEKLVEAFLATWVARFGVPATITSDRGPQFMSATWRDWCVQLGIQHSPTTAFHPQSNGVVERLHRRSRTPYVPGAALSSGPTICLGLCWAYEQPRRTRVACRPGRPPWGCSWPCQASF
jgi:hypothetical protein